MKKKLHESSDVSTRAIGTEAALAPKFIKVEANLLKLPLFALHTRGLGSLDGIECRGRAHRNGIAQDYFLSSTRNTATQYPGPLARSIHMAFLSIVSDRGFPFENPVTWTWRELCRRLEITYSGRAVAQLKAAIQSTRGLMIRSQQALYSRGEQKLIHTSEQSLALYNQVSFTSDSRNDGTYADGNSVCLSGWYLDNLNAFFTAPLDYTLWRYLDARSTIASRLYEFLLLNLYGDTPFLRINYKNLAQLLPVRAERYASDARRQLGPALEHLRETGVVEKSVWAEGKDGVSQLQFHRGSRLGLQKARDGAPPDPHDELSGAMEVAELRNQKPPEWGVVAEFYKLWNGPEAEPVKPSAKELESARELVRSQGLTKTKSLVALATKRMRVGWPQAKSFNALRRFLPDAQKDYERELLRLESQRAELARKTQERDRHALEAQSQSQVQLSLRPAWEALSDVERHEVRRKLLARQPYLAKSPTILESLCVEELVRRAPDDPPALPSPARPTARRR